MPSCKNDSKRKYKGTEPSPKGLGYCAHASQVGSVKKGKDGNKWIVARVSNGSQRWKKKNGKSKSKSNSNAVSRSRDVFYPTEEPLMDYTREISRVRHPGMHPGMRPELGTGSRKPSSLDDLSPEVYWHPGMRPDLSVYGYR